MAFGPIDFYSLAGWLFTQKSPHDEACARAIISRAYYGAFLEARNKAGIADKSSVVHRIVHDHYFRNGHQALANRLDDLRIKRNDTDYDTDKVITSMDSGKALKLAKRILQDIGFAFE